MYVAVKPIYYNPPVRQPNDHLIGADAICRRAASRICGFDHGGNALFRLRTSGSQVAFESCANFSESGCRYARTVGIKRLITAELHADQIQGFFNIPVDNVYASNVIIDDMQGNDFENSC